MSDEAILQLLSAADAKKRLQQRTLEKTLGDTSRAVRIRRRFLSQDFVGDFYRIPYLNFDYDREINSLLITQVRKHGRL